MIIVFTTMLLSPRGSIGVYGWLVSWFCRQQWCCVCRMSMSVWWHASQWPYQRQPVLYILQDLLVCYYQLIMILNWTVKIVCCGLSSGRAASKQDRAVWLWVTQAKSESYTWKAVSVWWRVADTTSCWFQHSVWVIVCCGRGWRL